VLADDHQRVRSGLRELIESHDAVKVHLHSVYQKIGAVSRADLVDVVSKVRGNIAH